jgi:hypothetical protein
LAPLPIFLFHQATWLDPLGYEGAAKGMYQCFLAQIAKYAPDALDRRVLQDEGTNLEEAVVTAKEWLAAEAPSLS